MGNNINVLDLDSLSQGIDVILPVNEGYFKTSCEICLDYHEHQSGVLIDIQQNNELIQIPLSWSGEITEKERNAFADLVVAAEIGACAIAFIIIRDLTEYKTISQSVRGTAFDYYLSNKSDDTLIFNDTACVEISGILEENDNNTIDKRVKSKKKRFYKRYPNEDSPNPAFIIVVDFKKPKSSMVTI